MLKNNNRPFMTVPEISEEFGFPVSTLKTLINQGAFPVMKVGRNTYVMREAFLSYLSSLSASSLATNSLSASSGNSFSTTHVENENGGVVGNGGNGANGMEVIE